MLWLVVNFLKLLLHILRIMLDQEVTKYRSNELLFLIDQVKILRSITMIHY